MRAFHKLNLTELVQLGREGDIGNIGRHMPRNEIYEVLIEGQEESTCELEPKRERLEEFIQTNYRRLRTQLPGCNGKCVSFGCPDLIVQRCWEMSKDDML